MRKFARGSGQAGIGGYTMIELAVVMIVGGLMMASFMGAYNLYHKTQAVQVTEERISNVTATLSQYLVVFGSYPCPARASATRTDPDYGVATQCDPNQTVDNGVNPTAPLTLSYPCSAASGCTVGAHAAGTCEAGLCWETSNRRLISPPNAANTYALVTSSPPTDATTGRTLAARSPMVRRGMIPFRTLGLTEEQAYDGYKMRMSYAVTEALAVPGSYLRQAGGIDIQDGAGHSLVKPPDMPDASFTPNVAIRTEGGGAHYVIFSAGEDRAGAYTRDGGLFAPCGSTGLDAENCNTTSGSFAVYNYASYSTASGATHYDDHMKYYSEIESPLWQVSTALGKDITDVITSSGGAVKIGIGDTPVPTGASLQVYGDVRASTRISASQICDATGTTCFSPSLTSSCPANWATERLLNGQVQCVDVSAGSTTAPCPPGQIAHGFNGTGKLLCKTIITCPLRQVQLCQTPSVDNRWLPASANGDSVDTRNLPLGAPLGYSGDPAQGAYGYYEIWNCGASGNWSRSSYGGSCTCTPLSGTVPTSCSSYYGYGTGTFTGTVNTTTTRVCPTGVTTTTTDTGGCVCTDSPPVTSTTSSSANCPTGFTGGPIITTTNGTWQCGPPRRWNYTTTTSGSCTCNTGATQTQNVACPTGYSGTVTQTSTISCPSGSWSAWAPAMTNPPPPPCACVGGTQYQTIGCGTGQIGTKDQRRTFDCSASPPDWTGWSTIDDTRCAAITYSWRPIGTPTACTTPLSYNLYDTCTSSGAQVSCSSPNGASYNCYNNQGCECQ